MAKQINTVCDMIKPVIEGMGFELWGCEMVGEGSHPLLRVYIDSQVGVNLDDCAKVSHQISGVLEVEDPIPTKYNLEVSSPGLDRLLFGADQFKKSIGKEVKIKLKNAISGRKNYTGILEAVEESNVTIVVDQQNIKLELENIEKARLVLHI